MNPAEKEPDLRVQNGKMFVALMPYLFLKETQDFGEATFLSTADTSFQPFIENAPAIKTLASRFTDNHGNKTKPSALLLSADISDDPRLWEIAAGIRNGYAIACIARGWQDTVGALNCHGNLYSDQYDFYAFLPTQNGQGLICLSPSFSSNSSLKHFQAQIYPDVPFAPPLGQPRVDEKLWPVVHACWKHYFLSSGSSSENSWPFKALFRSLAYAFKAARMPKGCDDLLFDYGINIGLWLSAFECLLRPEHELFHYERLFEIFEDREWKSPRLAAKQPFQIGKKIYTLNFVQRVIGETYLLRNDFLHGNPVTIEKLTKPATIKCGALSHILPILYKIAVEEFAAKEGFVQKPDRSKLEKLLNEGQFVEGMFEMLDDNRLEEALVTFEFGRCQTYDEQLAERGLKRVERRSAE